MATISTYQFVKDQILFKTGKYGIECPSCHKNATAYVSGLKKGGIDFSFRSYRPVRTSCRHCGTIVTFCWK
jgi:hypothetical protein